MSRTLQSVQGRPDPPRKARFESSQVTPRPSCVLTHLLPGRFPEATISDWTETILKTVPVPELEETRSRKGRHFVSISSRETPTDALPPLDYHHKSRSAHQSRVTFHRCSGGSRSGSGSGGSSVLPTTHPGGEKLKTRLDHRLPFRRG